MSVEKQQSGEHQHQHQYYRSFPVLRLKDEWHQDLDVKTEKGKKLIGDKNVVRINAQGPQSLEKLIEILQSAVPKATENTSIAITFRKGHRRVHKQHREIEEQIADELNPDQTAGDVEPAPHSKERQWKPRRNNRKFRDQEWKKYENGEEQPREEKEVPADGEQNADRGSFRGRHSHNKGRRNFRSGGDKHFHGDRNQHAQQQESTGHTNSWANKVANGSRAPQQPMSAVKENEKTSDAPAIAHQQQPHHQKPHHQKRGYSKNRDGHHSAPAPQAQAPVQTSTPTQAAPAPAPAQVPAPARKDSPQAKTTSK